MAVQALGNPLGNPLAQRAVCPPVPETSSFTRVLGVQALVYTPTIGTIVPPANAKYMRVAAIGAGGSAGGGAGLSGGGGGGCAASKIVMWCAHKAIDYRWRCGSKMWVGVGAQGGSRGGG